MKLRSCVPATGMAKAILFILLLPLRLTFACVILSWSQSSVRIERFASLPLIKRKAVESAWNTYHSREINVPLRIVYLKVVLPTLPRLPMVSMREMKIVFSKSRQKYDEGRGGAKTIRTITVDFILINFKKKHRTFRHTLSESQYTLSSVNELSYFLSKL